ncbi:ExeM/NucH family extracellular endonuclease [Neolewinella sp.]|uniref:ExeM/NucH family extracellular endonuclease n=1 Tax=Neolewinella sp. TaxID=2993543 RepID=UPI003B524274
MRLLYLILSCLLSTSLIAQGQVILTGLLDGTGPGATPRALELYVQGTVNLSDYTIQRYANTNTDGTPVQLSGTYTDAFVYVVNDTDAFVETFGTAGNFTNVISSGTVSGNGNDAFTLELGGTIIDQVGGPIGDDASIYTDSYLYRQDGTGPDGDWVATNWTIPGNDLLDGFSYAKIGAVVPFGSYQPAGGPSRPTVSIENPVNLAEPATDGSFSILLSEPAAAPFTVAFSLGGTATLGIDYLLPGDNTLTFATGEQAAQLVVSVLDDEVIEGTETIVLTLDSVSDGSYSLGAPAEVLILDDDVGTDPIGIHLIQGRGDVSPLAGDVVTIQAVVTGDFQEGLGGFYVQEEDADADQDSLTSEGIFVFAPDQEVTVGDLVTVTGIVEERFGQTQLRGGDAGARVTVEATGTPLPSARALMLPRPDSLLEALEGMRVTPRDLVITDVSSLARFGEVEVTSDERLIQFTECNRPNAAAFAAYQDSIAADRLLIDDGRGGSSNLPILFAGTDTLETTDQIRAGQTVSGLTGVLGYDFDRYRIQPTQTENLALSGNERPTTAPEVGGEIRVVSANVLNYFTTLGSRGADTEAELVRQEDKIVAALCVLDADIIGLIEIENNGNLALARLVDALTARCGVPYAYVESPNTGDDQIMVALVYRTDRIAESGTAAALATPAELFIGPGTNRVPLAQTFRVIDPTSSNLGEELTVSVNHFKSKGGGCGAGDDDDDGGAGNCNGTRTAGARALADWLATNPTGVADPNVLIIGDLNAYRMEDPIVALEDAGYVNAKTLNGNTKFPCGGGPPSYVFGGEWGSLDYALASDSLAPFITGATAWTVNTPEPAVLDYNTEGAGEDLYAPDFYRFSDHDPIVVGIDLKQIVNSVSNSVPGGSRVELQRLDTNTYTFSGMQRAGRYLLTNAAGQVLGHGVAPVRGARISVAELPTGIYFVLLREPGAGEAAFKLLVL